MYMFVVMAAGQVLLAALLVKIAHACRRSVHVVARAHACVPKAARLAARAALRRIEPGVVVRRFRIGIGIGVRPV